MWLVRYLFPFSRLLFCLNDIVLCYTEYFLFLFRYPIQKLYPVPMSSLSLFYFLLDSGYLALCWGPLFTKSWARCVDLFSLFCMQFDQHHLLKILGFPQCVELCLGLQFYSTGQRVCFYTNTLVCFCLFVFVLFYGCAVQLEIWNGETSSTSALPLLFMFLCSAIHCVRFHRKLKTGFSISVKIILEF